MRGYFCYTNKKAPLPSNDWVVLALEMMLQMSV
jgi:hypothetical protein